MRREPSLTFAGALRILGRHELPGIEKLDKVLGGVILAAGAAAGVATVGPGVLAPLKMFAAVWGWLEQKDAAIGLLRGAIGRVSDKLAGTRGRERRELIAAAHTVIVVAAFFEVFREQVGEKFYGSLAITEEEKKRLIGHGKDPLGKFSIFYRLYDAGVPAPSAARGFEENIRKVGIWYSLFVEYFSPFLDGLSVSEHVSFDWSMIRNHAVHRYHSHFIALAAKVPEFMIWALLNEGAATRSAVAEYRADEAGHADALLADGAATRSMIAGLRVDMAAAVDASRDALGRLAALLALDAGEDGAILDLRQSLAWANGGVLTEKIVPEDAQGYRGIEFPTVEESYVNPRFRVAIAGPQFVAADVTGEVRWGERWFDTIRPADEHWWDERVPRVDFDLMLAAYVTSPDATRLPMLLLGHPGAGKSMLTKVFAARLPPSAYTVVRVPLRRVGVNAPVRVQIEQALAVATNGRVDSWWQLAAQSQGTVLVVLLDGLDELLQASQADRSGYLQEVMEFQQHEAEQRQPVVVVVTSRTVVADRVDIPDGTTVVRLDFFENSDVADWLDRWRQVNAGAISAGKMRALTVESVLGIAPAAALNAATMAPEGADANHEEADRDERDDDGTDRRHDGIRELARQPLLLLMLALYAADPTLPPLGPDLATAALYQRLLESFCRREAAKALGLNPPRDQVNERMQDHLDRLSIAALAMFNRGRQDISEEELGGDLAVLDPSLMQRSRPVEEGQRIIGEFFFVHSPEARMLTGPGDADADRVGQPSLRDAPRRSYEFLHATFGEYLAASRVMNELVEVGARAFAGRRGPTEPDDNLLYALLSHQTLAARKSTLTFAKEIFAGLSADNRRQVLEVLEMLLGSYRHRQSTNRYAGYRPRPADIVRELAFYSANLAALRITLEFGQGVVPLTKLLRCEKDDALDQWRSMVMLWNSGLDPDGMQAMLGTMSFYRAEPGIRSGKTEPTESFGSYAEETIPVENEISLARLINDQAMEDRLQYGAAAVSGYVYAYADTHWKHMVASWLIPTIAGQSTGAIWSNPPEETSSEDIAYIAGLIFNYLRNPNHSMVGIVEDLLKTLFALPRVFELDSLALAATVLSEPGLIYKVPELADVEIYGQYIHFLKGLFVHFDEEEMSEEDIVGGQLILREWLRSVKSSRGPRLENNLASHSQHLTAHSEEPRCRQGSQPRD